MDNFKGQVTERVLKTLDNDNILICLLPANTTDRLQPLDVYVNKPAKTFLKGKFEEWYATEIVKQLEQQTTREDMIPVDLSLPCLKVLGAQWLTEMKDYISNNPQFIANGFVKVGITEALDNQEQAEDHEQENEPDYETDSCDGNDLDL